MHGASSNLDARMHGCTDPPTWMHGASSKPSRPGILARTQTCSRWNGQIYLTTLLGWREFQYAELANRILNKDKMAEKYTPSSTSNENALKTCHGHIYSAEFRENGKNVFFNQSAIKETVFLGLANYTETLLHLRGTGEWRKGQR